MIRLHFEDRDCMSASIAQAKVVVVGGTSGIGAAVATKAAEAGAQVVSAGRHSDPSIDVTDAQSVDRFFERVGDFDHLFVSVLTPSAGRISEINLDFARDAFDTKFWGAFHVLRSAASRVSKQGSVTFVGGVAAWRPSVGCAIMASMNAALVPLAQVAALELAPVRVNVLSPGIVDTPSWSSMSEAERRAFFAGIAGTVPAGRVGAPGDLAEAALFLMTNGYVTGSVLHVDGGLLLT
jgi:NAD(P)-dependent dehydrogenase (short-subunit alcohol dehydrogenase family)